MQDTLAETTARKGLSRGLSLAMSALMKRIDIVILVSLITAVGWWWSVVQMAPHDNGPWTALGPLGWFLVMWVIMMAAMMLPSVLPTVTLYAFLTRKRSPIYSLLFIAGYLLIWAVAGLIVYALSSAVGYLTGSSLTWDWIGRGVAAATLFGAAIYQITPMKSACLEKCRSPFAQLQSSWHDGWLGSVRMGIVNGAWCLGCCWAMMAGLFALGIMNLTWMAILAVIMAAEKVLPWKKIVTYGTAGLLLTLGILVLAAPQAIPGFTTPSPEKAAHVHSHSFSLFPSQAQTHHETQSHEHMENMEHMQH